MLPVKLNFQHLSPDVERADVTAWQTLIDDADKLVTQGGGRGADYLGWVDPAAMVSDDEIAAIKQLAAKIRANSDALVVIGIGGSYLGARAVIEALGDGSGPEILYAGNSLSPHYHAHLLKKLTGKRISINAISKSGTTTEPALAFRLIRSLLEKEVGKAQSKDRIVATTDEKKGALRHFATEEGYATLRIADDVGGRYSVLSPVGLLPIAVAGIDIDRLRQGAIDAAAACKTTDVRTNPAAFYAAARNILYRKGYSTELLASFEPRLHYLAEWWKQLFGESEGKNNMSLFPAAVDLTTDLHSMGQWIQQGRRNLIETFVVLDGGEPSLTVPGGSDLDELSYLEGKEVAYVNQAAYTGTALAHRDGGVPNMTFHLSELTAYSLGALLYVFERACGISGYVMGVNPFDQPGVEAYKKNMFALLGKPGNEKATAEVKEKLAGLPKDTNVSFA